MIIDVLGTKYKFLVDKPYPSDSICDYENKEIHITKDLGNREFEETVRHELIHAFMFESGLAFNFEHIEKGQEELMVDWFALQFTKIQKAFEQIMSRYER